MTGVDAHVAKAAGSLAKPVGHWLWRKARPDISRPSLIAYSEDLAEAVRRRETVLLDQLRGGPDMVIDALQFRWATETDVGLLADVGAYFRSQARSGFAVAPSRMLVLGEPGAGKTVLAIHLVLDQLNYRDTQPDAVRVQEPVPVRINAAGWDGNADFTMWLAHQLGIDYGIHGRVARELVDSGRILPVLDGLDEMDAPESDPVLASAALKRLSAAPWRNRALVVMCRTSVYMQIREGRGGLHGAARITLQPLSASAIRSYLDQYRADRDIASDDWAPVIDKLDRDPDGRLANALRTPWLLSLAATSLRRDPLNTATNLAACVNADDIRDLLFGSLIPAAVQGTSATGRNSDYTGQNVDKWMYTLAQHLEQRRVDHSGGAQISLDQIWRLAGPGRCRALRALLGLLIFGVAVTLAVRTASPAVSRLGGPFVAAPVAIFLWSFSSASRTNRFAWRVPGRSRKRRALALWFGAGVFPAMWVYIFSLFRREQDFRASIVAPLAVGLVLWLTLGLLAGFMTNPRDRLALGQDARRLIHDDLVSGFIVALAFAVASALLVATDFGFGIPDPVKFGVLDPAIGIRRGVVFGLCVGLAAGLWFTVSAERHAIACVLFAVTGTFPYRAARFLDWGRQTGLLRVTGIAYQFRHDTYQQWLCSRSPDHRSPPAEDPDLLPHGLENT
jgi:hypothetical protein